VARARCVLLSLARHILRALLSAVDVFVRFVRVFPFSSEVTCATTRQLKRTMNAEYFGTLPRLVSSVTLRQNLCRECSPHEAARTSAIEGSEA
jgi:hypothetical protein